MNLVIADDLKRVWHVDSVLEVHIFELFGDGFAVDDHLLDLLALVVDEDVARLGSNSCGVEVGKSARLLVADLDAALESATALLDAYGEFVRYVANHGGSFLRLSLLEVVVLAMFWVHEGSCNVPALFFAGERLVGIVSASSSNCESCCTDGKHFGVLFHLSEEIFGYL